MSEKAIPPRLKYAVITLICALYFLALWLPVIDLGSKGHRRDFYGPVPGYFVVGISMMPPLCIPWIANVLLVAGLYKLYDDRPTAAARWAAIASALGLSALWIVRSDYQLNQLRAGYYIWESCFVVLLIAAMALRERGRWNPERAESKMPRG